MSQMVSCLQVNFRRFFTAGQRRYLEVRKLRSPWRSCTHRVRAEDFFIFHLRKIPFLQFCNNCTFACCDLWSCVHASSSPSFPSPLPFYHFSHPPVSPPPLPPRSSWIIVSSYCHPLSWICCTNFQTATTFSPVLYSFFYGVVLHFLLFLFQSCRRKRWQSCPCTRGTYSVQAQTPQHCFISWTRHSDARQSCGDMSVYGVYGAGWLAHPPVGYGAERECFQRWLSRFCECQGKDVKMHVMTVCVCVCLLLVCKVGEHPSEEEAQLQPPCPHVCGKMFLRLFRQEHTISIVYFHSPLLLLMSLMVCERRVGREEGSLASVLKFRVCRDYCLAFCSQRLSYSWAFHETSLLEWTSSHLTDTSTEIWLPGIVCKLNGHIHLPISSSLFLSFSLSFSLCPLHPLFFSLMLSFLSVWFTHRKAPFLSYTRTQGTHTHGTLLLGARV